MSVQMMECDDDQVSVMYHKVLIALGDVQLFMAAQLLMHHEPRSSTKPCVSGVWLGV